MKTKLYLLASLLIVLPLVPFAKGARSTGKQDWGRREHVYKARDNFSDFEIRYKGKILVTDDDKDIKSISPNGYLEITKASFGNKRRLIFESDGSGRLTRKYYEGKGEDDYNKYGKEWLEDILEEVIEKTGIGGKDRILRIYNQKGLRAALDEIDDVSDRSSYSYSNFNVVVYRSVRYDGINVQNLYFKALADEVDFDDNELYSFLRAVEDIVSNSTKGTILRGILKKYELKGQLMEQFLETTASLSYNTERGNTLRAFQAKYKVDRSNYQEFFDVIVGMDMNSEKGNVLKPLLRTQDLEERVLEEMFESVERFSSEYEAAAVLRLALKQAIKKDVGYEFNDAVRSIDGSYYLLRDELQDMISDYRSDEAPRNYSKDRILDILDIAMHYDANTRKTPKLRKVHSSLTNDREVMEAYWDVIHSQTQPMSQYNVLLEMINEHQLDVDGWVELFDVAEDIARKDYKHAASALLRDAIDLMPANDLKVIDGFFDVLDEIDHNSGKEEIIRMFCEKGKASKEVIVYLLKTVEDIDMDVEKATSLIQIAKVLPSGNKELKELFDNIANDMESDYEYDRVMKSI